MTTAYDQGRKNAGGTDAPPCTQTLKNSGYTDTQVSEFYRGYNEAKK